jgi:hypothetical protein
MAVMIRNTAIIGKRMKRTTPLCRRGRQARSAQQPIRVVSSVWPLRRKVPESRKPAWFILLDKEIKLPQQDWCSCSWRHMELLKQVPTQFFRIVCGEPQVSARCFPFFCLRAGKKLGPCAASGCPGGKCSACPQAPAHKTNIH